ncbi:unknown [Megasphaera elsdenii CAG:570]|uniref:Uncharacterized protein n=1 Tax=Megasphaera elsdenii CAG:570 TaxID=1263087 RepID=R7N0X3_MEGEL|nr:unknown [Megasphaera elsdenii CAG:570]
MVPCRADAGDDAFADAGDDRRFTGTADEAVDVGADRDPGPDLQFDAVLGDSRDERRFDDFRIDAHLDGFQDVAAGQVDGAGPFKGQGHRRPMGRDEGVDDAVDVTAGQVMGFQLIDVDVEAGFIGLDQGQDDLGRYDPAQAHADKVDDAYGDAGCHGRDPQADGHEVQEQGYDDDSGGDDDDRYG